MAPCTLPSHSTIERKYCIKETANLLHPLAGQWNQPSFRSVSVDIVAEELDVELQ
jgi:hypothetical protein